MAYPSLEQYQLALASPATALIDPDLRLGSVETSGLGVPLALCGGFALTYTIDRQQKKFAVRCFHKQATSLEQRYDAISRRLAALRSNYFVDFAFQPKGVRVGGNLYPVVKMAWASGQTMGEFLDRNHGNRSALENLRASLARLEAFLRNSGIAHGDIQPGNVMVAANGTDVTLIDYDGMFVEDLRGLKGNEQGHRNFQHPERTQGAFDERLDRFSFIHLDVALTALTDDPTLWKATNSDGDAILFRANDFVDPISSRAFSLVGRLPALKRTLDNFASVCTASFNDVPSFEDFSGGRAIPKPRAIPAQVVTGYISPFTVLDARNYAACVRCVGDRVELVGRILDIRHAKTKYGRPYVFINFTDWRGNAVKISIWSSTLKNLTNKPDDTWVQRWISVVGLMDPPYEGRTAKGRVSYTHLSISLTDGGQISFISEEEARYRLGGPRPAFALHKPLPSNRDRIEQLRAPASSVYQPLPQAAQLTKNQQLVASMKVRNVQPASSPLTPTPSQRPRPAPSQPKYGASRSGCVVIVLILLAALLAGMLGGFVTARPGVRHARNSVTAHVRQTQVHAIGSRYLSKSRR